MFDYFKNDSLDTISVTSTLFELIIEYKVRAIAIHRENTEDLKYGQYLAIKHGTSAIICKLTGIHVSSVADDALIIEFEVVVTLAKDVAKQSI